MSQPPDRRSGGRSPRRFDGAPDRGPSRGAGSGPPNRPFSRPGARPTRPGGPRFDRDGSGGRGRPERDGAGGRYGETSERRPYEPRRADRPPSDSRGDERSPYGSRGGEGRGPQSRPTDRRPRRPEGRPTFQPRRPEGRPTFQPQRRDERGGPADRPGYRLREGGQRPSPYGGSPSPRPTPFSSAGSTGPSDRLEGENFAGAAPSDLIWGRHSAQAVLEGGRPVHRIWCTPEMRFSPRFLQLLREAKASGVLVEEVTWARLGQISGGAVHQGIVLQPAAAETLDLASLIDGCRSIGEAPLLLAVDGLTDPQNLGAIVRSAEALGAHGMVLPQRRNAGLTGSVAKVAAGALEHLPIARVVNLNRSLDTLKQEGYRVIGLAGEGTVSLEEADLDGPLVIVTGSEGDGLSLLTRRNCDQLVRIPLRGSTPSLNASVATALLLYEVARRSWMKGLSGSSPAPRLVRPALPTPAPQAAAPAEGVAEEPGLADAIDPGLIADLDRGHLEQEAGTATADQPAELVADAVTLPDDASAAAAAAAPAPAPATAWTPDSGPAAAGEFATALDPEPGTAPTPWHATLADDILDASHDPASGVPNAPVDPAPFDTDVRL